MARAIASKPSRRIARTNTPPPWIMSTRRMSRPRHIAGSVSGSGGGSGEWRLLADRSEAGGAGDGADVVDAGRAAVGDWSAIGVGATAGERNAIRAALPLRRRITHRPAGAAVTDGRLPRRRSAGVAAGAAV